jgi:hypothetical protein
MYLYYTDIVVQDRVDRVVNGVPPFIGLRAGWRYLLASAGTAREKETAIKYTTLRRHRGSNKSAHARK